MMDESGSLKTVDKLSRQVVALQAIIKQMGEQAAKVVLRRIRTPQYLVQSQTTLPILIERQSTKKLP